MDGEFGVNRCKLLHLEWISIEVLLYSTGNSIQSLEITMMEDNKRKSVCVCVCVLYIYNIYMLYIYYIYIKLGHLPYSRNWHNTVNQLYFNKKQTTPPNKQKIH